MTTTRTQEILLDEDGVLSTQYLVLDCEDGRPTSITDVQVWAVGSDDTSSEESATTGSGSVETNPNTTLSAAAGPAQSSPRALTLTSGTGVAIGRRIQITEDGTGVYEVGEVASVNGTAVTLRHPLKNDYSTGSLVQSCRATIALSTTWLADSGNLSPLWSPNPGYRVKWTVVINGNPAPYTRYFDCVRYVAGHGVLPVDVDRILPGWLDDLPPDHQVDQGRELIESAFGNIKFRFYGDNLADQAVRNAELLSQLVIHQTVLDSLEMRVLRGAQNMDAAIDKARERLDRLYNQVVRSPVAPVDTGGGGASQPVKPLPLWRR
jgi:hypothetical protein